MIYYSQHGQDKYLIEELFQGKKNGVFVEIGGFNGEGMSNCVTMERYLDWHGIIFEPMPDRFQEILKNRKCIAMQAAVSDREGEEDFLLTKGWTEMLNGLVRTYEPAHQKRISNEMIEYGGTQKVIKVNTVLLDKTLLYYDMAKVDYCSIDVEGAEYSIITSIDFSKVDIYCFTIENNYEDDRIEKFMKTKGYRKIKKFGTDDLYVKDR